MELKAPIMDGLRLRRADLQPQQRHPVNKIYLQDVEDTLALLERAPGPSLEEAKKFGQSRLLRSRAGLGVAAAVGAAGAAWMYSLGGSGAVGPALGALVTMSVGLVGGVAALVAHQGARRECALLGSLEGQSPARAADLVLGRGTSREDLVHLMQATRSGLPEGGLGVASARAQIDRDLAVLNRAPGSDLADIQARATARHASASRLHRNLGRVGALAFLGSATTAAAAFCTSFHPILSGAALVLGVGWMASAGLHQYTQSVSVERPAATLRVLRDWSAPLELARQTAEETHALARSPQAASARLEEGFLSVGGVRIKVRGAPG